MTGIPLTEYDLIAVRQYLQRPSTDAHHILLARSVPRRKNTDFVIDVHTGMNSLASDLDIDENLCLTSTSYIICFFVVTLLLHVVLMYQLIVKSD
jgi:hypothetical protein